MLVIFLLFSTVCQSCGKTGHLTTRSLQCEKHHEYEAATAASSSSAATAVCSACGKAGHATTRSVQCEKHHEYVPSASSSSTSHARATWVHQPEVDEYVVTVDMDQIEEHLDGAFKAHVRAVVEKGRQLVVTRTEEEEEDDDTEDLSRLSIFHTIGEGIFTIIMPWCKKEAVRRGIRKIATWEFYSWVAVYIGSNLINLNMEESLEYLEARFFQTHANCTTSPYISRDRYLEITSCIRGIDPDDETEGQDTWSSSIDDIDKMREFEKGMYKMSRKVFLTPHSQLVIDDELVGSRSKSVQSKALSHRKAGKEGLKNDAVADSFLKAMLSVRHKQRLGYSQHNVVQELVKEILAVQDGPGLMFTADRGYSSAKAWAALASLDAGFIMVSKSGKGHGHAFNLRSATATSAVPGGIQTDEESTIYAQLTEALNASEFADGDSDNEEDDEESSASEGENQSESPEEPQLTNDLTEPDSISDGDVPQIATGVVDDSSLLGSQIRVATRKVQSSRDNQANEIVLTAVSFRGYEKKQNKNLSSVVRIVLAGIGLADINVLKSTICMEPVMLPLECNASELLFHPRADESGSEKIKSVMTSLSEHVNPLTCYQRTADWFVLRLFHVTGTMGGFLSNRDDQARTLLHSDPGASDDPSEELVNIFLVVY